MSIDPTTLLTWLTCLAILLGGIFTAMKLGSRMLQMLDNFNGTKGQPGVLEEMRNIKATVTALDDKYDSLDRKVDDIHAEVNYNHGGSVKDVVEAIQTDVKGIHERLDKI